jgi:hypothetical protein
MRYSLKALVFVLASTNGKQNRTKENQCERQESLRLSQSPVRGLWQRNGIFYAQINKSPCRASAKVARMRLQNADQHDPQTVPQAVSGMQELLSTLLSMLSSVRATPQRLRKEVDVRVCWEARSFEVTLHLRFEAEKGSWL